MSKQWIWVAMAALVCTAAHAGNEGRGTEDDVLIGKAIRQSLDAEGLKNFEARTKAIADAIASGALKRDALVFFRQAEPEKFSVPSEIYQVLLQARVPEQLPSIPVQVG